MNKYEKIYCKTILKNNDVSLQLYYNTHEIRLTEIIIFILSHKNNEYINDLERCECDGFIIKATKDKPPIINKDKLIKICKTRYGLYLPTDFDYKNNIVLFRGRYTI